ncbi:hypothetical protein KIN20_035286 [Parelaphostrongylus tenuis]|uniref:Uncharacterized protein n=1 Tax=Parelaphostrongylus tenuis TaxID=148309 RepID=A0AAD5RAY4_PARTN|nr:hypothetical protein KIN20_035286 [Parelaphostrongylus tenuis]
MCTTANAVVTTTLVPDNFKSISGTLSTINIIMTNWPKAMRQSVVNRAIRMLTMRPVGSSSSRHLPLSAGN